VGPRACAVALAAGIAGPAAAQEPTGPPPAPQGGKDGGSYVHELLPDLGRIGAQVGVLAGGSWNPDQIGSGAMVGGYIDLPLFRAGGGKVSYQVLMGLSLATGDPFSVTDLGAYVANLVAGATPQTAMRGPTPVARSVRTRQRLLQLSPFGLKYTLTGGDHVRLRPYLAAGVDVLVILTQEHAADGGPPPVGMLSPSAGAVVQGIRVGQGSLELGAHAAAGLEVRVAAGLSLNGEYRFTGIDGIDRKLHTVTAALGFHW
jgi:opacity protein-like surface antigen